MNANADETGIVHAHRWTHRILMVFTPDDGDPRLNKFNERVQTYACGMADRDLIAARLSATGSASFGTTRISSRSAWQIRRDYQIKENAFAVVLVGRDGGEKLRLAEVPDFEDLFDLIDSMPMRMAEMRERNRRCPA